MEEGTISGTSSIFKNSPIEPSSKLSNSSKNRKLSGSKETPRKCVNPFDVGLDKLRCSSYFSPNVFACQPKSILKDNQSFRWSIDQIAGLKPMDIDESSHQEHAVDSETEELAQTAIDEFFSKNKVAPSPWVSDSKVESSIPKSHHVTFSPNLASTAYYERYEEVASTLESMKEPGNTKSVWTQTVLSLPADLDIEKILSQYCTFNEDQQRGNDPCLNQDLPDDVKDANNCHSLRRKLFDHNDDDQTQRRQTMFMYKAGKVMSHDSPPVSPLPVHTPPRYDEFNDNHNTPGSSSPITPCDERKVTDYRMNGNLISPSVSPIAKSAFKTPSTGSLRSEGMFRIPSSASSISDVTPKKGLFTSFQLMSDDSIKNENFETCGHTNVTNQFELLSTETGQNTNPHISEQDTGYQSASLLSNVSSLKFSICKVFKLTNGNSDSPPKKVEIKPVEDF